MPSKNPGIPRRNPLSYTGPKFNLIPVFGFPREPTISDNTYLVSSFIVILDNPTSGTKGDLWYLSEYNSGGEAVWLQILTDAEGLNVRSITTDSGVPSVDPDDDGNINILGGDGITVTGQGPGDTVTITSSENIWTVITSATQELVDSNGYFANNGSGVTFSLPAVAAVGDTFKISAINAGGWSVEQNSGQTIKMGSVDSTTGIGGSFASTANGDSLEIVCSIEDSNFVVINSIGIIFIT